MKKINLIIIMILAFSNIYSQVQLGADSQILLKRAKDEGINSTRDLITTSNEEWLYCSKGYGEQTKNGLDATKEGYSIKKVHTALSHGRSSYIMTELRELFDLDKKELKAMILTVKKPNSNKVANYCIVHPHTNKALRQKSLNNIARDGEGRKNTLMVALSEYYFYSRMGKIE